MSKRKKARKGSRVMVNARGATGWIKQGAKGKVIDASHPDFAWILMDDDQSRIALNHAGIDPLTVLDRLAEID